MDDEQYLQLIKKHNEEQRYRKKLKAKIAELKAALKPFADLCDIWTHPEDEDNYMTLIEDVKVGDLRAARKALEKSDEKK